MATTEALKTPVAAAGTAPLLKVRGLEAWFGVPLFERHGNRMALMPHSAELCAALGRSSAGTASLCGAASITRRWRWAAVMRSSVGSDRQWRRTG